MQYGRNQTFGITTVLKYTITKKLECPCIVKWEK